MLVLFTNSPLRLICVLSLWAIAPNILITVSNVEDRTIVIEEPQMDILETSCNTCGFRLDWGIGGTMYVINDTGERIITPHPLEYSMRDAILGEDASEELINEKTGFLQSWLCLDCLSISSLDLKRDTLKCQECNSIHGEATIDMVGQRCPRCNDPSSEIEVNFTGWVT